MSSPLDFLLALQAECGGAIPVERYMREALYHPEFGYYARNIRHVGRRGDFSTSASLGEALGAALASWIATNRFPGRRWHVIEAGAGTGALARTVLRQLGFWRRRGLVYHIVETSPVLREEQRRTLASSRIEWHIDMREALEACAGEALIFSNELIDAFPCRTFACDGARWSEIGVRIDGGKIFEQAIDRPTPESTAFDIRPAAGLRVEVQTAAAEWLASWSGAARRARLLTIDYGDTMPALYHRRPAGTLRAYFHHQRYDGGAVYHRFGKQDLTCDVNFSDLRKWAEHCGWRTHTLITQADFLRTYGTIRTGGLHDAQLAEHTGAGGAFKVLLQSRGIDVHPPATAGRVA